MEHILLAFVPHALSVGGSVDASHVLGGGDITSIKGLWWKRAHVGRCCLTLRPSLQFVSAENRAPGDKLAGGHTDIIAILVECVHGMELDGSRRVSSHRLGHM